MENIQHKNNETPEVTEEIRTNLPIGKNRTLIKKKRNRPRHKLKRTRIKIITFDIHETRRTVIYKKLPRRLILQEMNTTK